MCRDVDLRGCRNSDGSGGGSAPLQGSLTVMVAFASATPARTEILRYRGKVTTITTKNEQTPPHRHHHHHQYIKTTTHRHSNESMFRGAHNRLWVQLLPRRSRSSLPHAEGAVSALALAG
jgi:hypothetical protein